MCDSKQIEPLFLIDEETVERLSRNRAQVNNDLARDCGQDCRVAASDLCDLYYKQGGRCAMCGDGLTNDTIALDHIAEIHRRVTRQMAMAGRDSVHGQIADIENLQWCCKSCNKLKEFCRRNGKQMHAYLSAVVLQAKAGFPIRSKALPCGRMSTRRKRRLEVLANLFALHGNRVTVAAACDSLRDTDFDCCEQVVHRDLLAVGWKGVSERVAAKANAVSVFVESCPRSMASKADWYRAFRRSTSHLPECKMSIIRFFQIAEEFDIHLAVDRPGRAVVTGPPGGPAA